MLTVEFDLLVLGLHEDDDVATQVHHPADPALSRSGPCHRAEATMTSAPVFDQWSQSIVLLYVRIKGTVV